MIRLEQPVRDHEQGMQILAGLLTRPNIAVLENPDEIRIVGHRVVHGGQTLTETTVITAGVKEKIKALYPLAPLHNPGHIKGIEVIWIGRSSCPACLRTVYLPNQKIYRCLCRRHEWVGRDRFYCGRGRK